MKKVQGYELALGNLVHMNLILQSSINFWIALYSSFPLAREAHFDGRTGRGACFILSHGIVGL